jgi:YesN/AraC family two-component response regulator
MATLLIVDDDSLVRDTLHELLSASHECHTADRAEQALAYLDVETYDAVLTDISMPGLSGREILNYIQDKHPATPVIVISGMPYGGYGHEVLEMGAFAFFTKPFRLEDIEDAVDRAIALHKELAGVDPMLDQSKASPLGEPYGIDSEVLTKMYVQVGQGKTFEQTDWPDDFRSTYDEAIRETEEITAKGGEILIAPDLPKTDDDERSKGESRKARSNWSPPDTDVSN